MCSIMNFNDQLVLNIDCLRPLQIGHLDVFSLSVQFQALNCHDVFGGPFLSDGPFLSKVVNRNFYSTWLLNILLVRF